MINPLPAVISFFFDMSLQYLDQELAKSGERSRLTQSPMTPDVCHLQTSGHPRV